MMIDINKKYKTKSGLKVRIYAIDGQGAFPVHGAILISKSWRMRQWMKDGSATINTGGSNNDIIEVRPRHKRTVWMNMYSEGFISSEHEDKEAADRSAFAGRIACIKVELDFAEGDGL